MKLKTLTITTILLLITSIFVYTQENKRGTDLLTGSDFIKGLDINKVQKITLTFRDDKNITFSRDSNKFVLENYKSYPASMDRINDLIYKVASIEVREKIGNASSEDELKKYELDQKNKNYQIDLMGHEGKKIVSFRVGKNIKGRGNYLYKEGTNEVYLSQEVLWLNSSYKDFINTALFSVSKEDIENISLFSDKKLKISKNQDHFVFEEPSDKKFKREKAEEYANSFSSIQFEDFLPLTEEKVQNLTFDKEIEISLKNKLVYKVMLAKNQEEHFIKISALLKDSPNQIVINQNDNKEDLAKIEGIIKAQGEAQAINREKSRWVYKVDKSVFDKLARPSQSFL